MSSLRGEPGSALTLPRSVDVLAAAASRAGRPGAIWLSGIAYQSVVLGWTFGAVVAGPLLRESLLALGLRRFHDLVPVKLHPLPGVVDLLTWVQRNGVGAALVSAPIILVAFRLAAGLARLSPANRWDEARGDRRTPRLRLAWRAGKGLTLASVAMWLQFLLMMFGATLVFVGPAQLFLNFVHLDTLHALTAILSGLMVALLLIYSFLLSILFQLALHSLVQNRRGVGSALLHAWRIAKNEPMATVRATAADAVLYFTVFLLELGLFLSLGWLQATAWVATLLGTALIGFAGCTRCAFWASAYQNLGGLSTVDDAPGG